MVEREGVCVRERERERERKMEKVLVDLSSENNFFLLPLAARRHLRQTLW